MKFIGYWLKLATSGEMVGHLVSRKCMQDMNGMKDKFDTALKRIGDEIDADQKEQDEKNAGS